MVIEQPSFHIVPAGRGLHWFSAGFALFWRQPWLWLGITMVFLLILLTLGQASWLAMAAPLLMLPMFGGLQIGCAQMQGGEALEFDHLLAGFQAPLRGLLGLAAAYIVMQLFTDQIGKLLARLMGLQALFDAMNQAGTGNLEPLMNTLPSLAGVFMLWLSVVAVLAFLVSLAFLFAPALVAVGRVLPQAALLASFRAASANWRALSVYGLVFALFALVAMCTVLGAFLLLPLSITTAYIAYRDVFADLPEQLSENP
ncbi:BPSS1780 family membrane protein [Chitinimonas sp.]|uniref:BPSS1780 family membrane protein n=1 Tax=Chitinimonas sp. TaxID=1934313 RepID=UPI0035B3676C